MPVAPSSHSIRRCISGPPCSRDQTHQRNAWQCLKQRECCVAFGDFISVVEAVHDRNCCLLQNGETNDRALKHLSLRYAGALNTRVSEVLGCLQELRASSSSTDRAIAVTAAVCNRMSVSFPVIIGFSRVRRGVAITHSPHQCFCGS